MLSRLLADAVHAPGPLDQADDGPGQIVVDDDAGSPAGSGPSLSTSVAISTRSSSSARHSVPLARCSPG